MVMEKGAGVVDRLMVVYRSVVEDDLILSIVIRVCFAYGFRLIWNSSSSRVWLKPFWAGYKYKTL